MKNITIGLMALSLLLSLSSCTSATKTETAAIDNQIKTQAPADSPDQIRERAALAFSNAEGLTAEQKLKISVIYSRVYAESMRIRREMGQSKSLLFMTLAKVNYKDTEIKTLKSKIVRLDQERLNLMFGALDDVQGVVGKGVQAEKIYRHFQDYEIQPHLYMRKEF